MFRFSFDNPNFETHLTLLVVVELMLHVTVKFIASLCIRRMHRLKCHRSLRQDLLVWEQLQVAKLILIS